MQLPAFIQLIVFFLIRLLDLEIDEQRPIGLESKECVINYPPLGASPLKRGLAREVNDMASPN